MTTPSTPQAASCDSSGPSDSLAAKKVILAGGSDQSQDMQRVLENLSRAAVPYGIELDDDDCATLLSYIRTLEREHRAMRESIVAAVHREQHFGCSQGCGGSGAIQISEDEVQQCQWCDESNRMKDVLSSLTLKP